MSGLWSGQFKSEPISGPWRCLSRHLVFFPTQLVLCRQHKFAMGGHHLWVSKDIFYWQQSKEVLRSFANEGVLISLMNCWKVLITPPYHFHTLSPSNFLMQIKTPFTQHFSKACVHFSSVFFANLFLVQSVCPDLFLKASHLFRQISPCHAFSYKYTTMSAPLL